MSAPECASCGFANRPGALFCGSCGAQLGRTCPACSAVVAPGLAFCTSCGTELAPAEQLEPLREERKVVSVLFADLVDSTRLAEQGDPEDVRRLLDAFHALAKTEIERYGGTVEKYIGDAVMALFGAPRAHEDDPERAVRAAIAIREAVGDLNAEDGSLDLHARVGVTTGEAVVRLGARPERGESMAAGDVVNTGARLQSAAPVDGILVDEATHGATDAVIEYRQAPAVDARGKSAPVAAWEVVAARTRLGVDIAFRGGAELVGREHELRLLRDSLLRAQSERAPQLVTLVGAPGIGKSRLLFEFYSVLHADPSVLVSWRQGRSLPYGEGVSFWALGEIVKSQAGILESDTADTAAGKLRLVVETTLADRDEAGWVLDRLAPLVGVGGDSPVGGREESFAAWRRFFESLADQRPLVLVFEDVHWADDGLLDFVDHLVDWANGFPLLVVCTARPEFLERRAGWGGGKRNAITVTLSPLSDDETARLLEALLGERALEPPEQRALLARAGGNPLYAEEYVRMLMQHPDLAELPLPDSVQGIVAARLDTLPAEEKALVQDAAVIGKVFWPGALAAVSRLAGKAVEEALRTLDRKEFVRRERRSSVAGEAAYVFRHVLVRDVAYAQIPRSQRAARHRLAAEWIESLAAGRPEDVADMVAHHYRSALQFAPAGTQETAELAERARLAFRDAGDRAAALNAFPSAARYYESALELWPPDDPGRPRLLLRLGGVLYPRGLGADVLAEAAEELLDAGDREGAAEAHALLGELHWLKGARDRTFEELEGAVRLLEDAPPSRAKAFSLGDLARFRMTAAEVEEAVRLGFAAYVMAEELGLDELRSHTLNTLGTARVMQGDRGGLVDLERAIEIAGGLDSGQVVRGYNNLASTYFALGELERAFELYARARHEAERLGWSAALGLLDADRVDELYYRGRWDDARALADELLASTPEDSRHRRFTDVHDARALIRLADGDAAGALEDSGRALESARLVRDPQTLFLALACRTRVLLGTGQEDEALAVLDELVGRWRESPASFASTWLPAAAVVAQALGRAEGFLAAAAGATMPTRWLEAAGLAARGDFPAAARAYAAIGSLPDEAEARLLGAEALAAAGRRGEAEEELSSALAFYRAVGADACVRRAAELLAAA
ncbi:MAG TPA: adenylate/guanylate cyclase domain-containing protein [Gaiellaceae bacterium]|nr:adenylate/guanylate cyclase domain-containing protein [Gaiellaceae bacterium]